MFFPKTLRALTGIAALAMAVPSFADAPSEVTITASRASIPCAGHKGDEARQVAEQATRDGAHRKAAECFRAAGDANRADRALVRASVDASEVVSRQAAANVETAKAQARRIREAFH
ncbi:MAG TPA: hypothetical protein VG994_11005 [Steroidobacteraceae bacterium]|nr:hypothetical protein [Steroidobacteraceae bacterium]